MAHRHLRFKNQRAKPGYHRLLYCVWLIREFQPLCFLLFAAIRMAYVWTSIWNTRMLLLPLCSICLVELINRNHHCIDQFSFWSWHLFGCGVEDEQLFPLGCADRELCSSNISLDPRCESRWSQAGLSFMINTKCFTPMQRDLAFAVSEWEWLDIFMAGFLGP